MSLWDKYYTQVIGLHHYTGTDDYGNTCYRPPLKDKPHIIQCRIEYFYKEIIDKAGNKITSSAIVFCNHKLSNLDIVVSDGVQYMVQSCQPIYDLNGRLDHYEIYL